MSHSLPEARSPRPEAEGGLTRFGAFELDVRSRELRSAGTRIRLQEQPFEILRLMLERSGDVVTREELRQRLWPDGTFVDFEHSLNAAVKRLRAALGDDADNPRFVQTVPRRGYRFVGMSTPEREDAIAVPQVRLAVLPFTNLTDRAAQEYFTDGLTEEMIAQLGQRCRGRIGVMARWSSMVFKGSVQSVRDIGRTLRVDYLLEGSVRREGDRVRITARLVATDSETHLWSETYERDLTDCLSVQADVAAKIAESLTVELVPEEAPAGSGAPASASAYQEYLKGRYYWNRWLTPDDPIGDQALSQFEAALRIDPDFAPACASLARVHVQRAVYYCERPRAALEAARIMAKRAIERDPQHSEAHLALADVRRMLEWDWRGAEAAYLQAIALNPSLENSHRGYGTMLAGLARHTEAIRELERACELDPLCLVVGTSAAWVRYVAGDYQAALDHCRRVNDLDPQYLRTRDIVGAVYLQTGKVRDALAVLGAAHAQAPHDAALVASLVHATAGAADHQEAAALVAELQRPDRTRYLSPYYLALAQVGIGDHDAAFEALEQAVASADPALVSLAVEPRFEAVRSDSRYTRLVDRLGLP